MKTIKEELMELSYEIYSKDHEITFDDFWDKVINDEEFGKYFDDVLWPEAIRTHMNKHK